MTLEYQILAAVGLDLMLGDPHWFPHPVRFIGRLALGLETPMRRLIGHPKTAGIATVLLVVGSAGFTAWGLVRLTGLIHPLAADIVSVVLIYTTIAARDLARHSMAVFRPLVSGQLPEARRRLSMIVGRDTARLDTSEITRATVESVAESTVDGVTAPLFFACVGGPVAAMAYRAINTLDSTFGYKTERYLHFGWASARLDDAANFIPARITAPLITMAAGLLGLRPVQALRIWLRDGRNHSSPNAGLAEAAMAGALGVQLGGVNYYEGESLAKPTIGDPAIPLAPRHILQANLLMFTTAGLFLAAALAARIGVVYFFSMWRHGL
jgi:adenosylcobinamide-phosphate synthase